MDHRGKHRRFWVAEVVIFSAVARPGNRLNFWPLCDSLQRGLFYRVYGVVPCFTANPLCSIEPAGQDLVANETILQWFKSGGGYSVRRKCQTGLNEAVDRAGDARQFDHVIGEASFDHGSGHSIYSAAVGVLREDTAAA